MTSSSTANRHSARGFCATCGVPFDQAQPVARDGGISGPLCARCDDIFACGDPEQLRALIDVYEDPLLVIGLDHHIIAANLAAIEAVGDEIKHIIGNLPGNVITCENASLPGGCGHTVNCRTCVFNNSVTTALVGVAEVTGVPAHQTIVRKGKHLQQTFEISAQRIEDRVLVKMC